MYNFSFPLFLGWFKGGKGGGGVLGGWNLHTERPFGDWEMEMVQNAFVLFITKENFP